MGTNTRMFWILSGFFFFAAALYTGWSLLDANHRTVEWVGTIAIALSGVLAAFIAFYVGRVHKSQSGELPEDRLDANIDDGDAEQGHFSPWSWWPIVLAGSAAVVVLGLAIGPWLSFIGAGVLIVSVVGWVYEYYRGYFAR
ncbi:MAG: cytochrome c oxidase subunit 4 [Rhodoglobus sp.]